MARVEITCFEGVVERSDGRHDAVVVSRSGVGPWTAEIDYAARERLVRPVLVDPEVVAGLERVVQESLDPSTLAQAQT